MVDDGQSRRDVESGSDVVQICREQSRVAAALRSRGIEEPSTTVAAELATLAFSQTVTAWAAPDNTEEFHVIARRVLREVHTAAAELS